MPPEVLPMLSNTVSLVTVDSSLSQTWLRLKFNDTNTPRTFQLLRDGIQITQGSLNASSTADTLIVDSGLTIGKSYRYSARRMDASNAVVDSAVLTVNTLDSTSHNFVWTTETLGEGTSYLRDVCIINDTCIWITGQIYLRDSTGQVEAVAHNAACWDGTKWHITKVFFPVGTILVAFDVRAVYAFSPSDVWFMSGASFSHFKDGIFTTRYDSGIAQGQLTKMWGTSSNNLYAVGDLGTIIHYDGVSWKKMESGTSVDLTDIFGTPDGKHVWACGGTNAPNLKSVLLQ
ncbi:MAG: hypothetical protein IAF08_13315, partial [Rhizobacter sp.]|nr:hypothetical protein [Chlorobiales bacterium]